MSGSKACRNPEVMQWRHAGRRVVRVLCVGYEKRLLNERATALRSGGFTVFTASSVEIVDEARLTSPQIAVVLLYRSCIRDAGYADAVLSVDSGPQFLAGSLRYLLLERTGRSSTGRYCGRRTT